MSKLGNLFTSTYGMLAGVHPFVRPWHFQWAAMKDLNKDLKGLLSDFSGAVLDYGCGNKPYRSWIDDAKVTSYVGVDIAEKSGADYVIQPSEPLPFQDASFDVVFSTQVLEHVQDMDFYIQEITRVLKPGGRLIIALPFLYNAHGVPEDYRRMTVDGLRHVLSDDFEDITVKRQGGVGTCLATTLLNWIDETLTLSFPARILKGVLMPLWIVFCFAANMVCALLDWVDRTPLFYGNVLATCRRK